MSDNLGIIHRLASPFAGVVNRARLGFPRRFFKSTGTPADDLAATVVFRELSKRGSRGLAFASPHAVLFERNHDIDEVIRCRNNSDDIWLQLGLPMEHVARTKYDPLRDADEPPAQHALIEMCQRAGIGGPVELRPYFFLSREEFTAGKLSEGQVVMQSTSFGEGGDPMRNREWYADRFQEVCSELRTDVQVIQLGSENDPKLEGATDLRGKATMRHAAAILANAYVFIGLAGFYMHLARAVDCRSVIVYGGREKPTQTGYVANKNLYTQVKCAPCWLRNPCDYDHKCMDMISASQVISATAEQIAKYGSLLEVQTAQL